MYKLLLPKPVEARGPALSGMRSTAHLGDFCSAGGAPRASKAGLELRRLGEQLAGVRLQVWGLLGGMLLHPTAHHIPEHLGRRVCLQAERVGVRA